MSTDAQIGWGGKFFLQNEADEWVELEEILETPFPEGETEDVEATHMQSPNRRREFIAGLINDGTGDVLMNYVPGSTTDVLCRDLQDSGITTGYRVHLLQPDSSYWQIQGECIIKKYGRSSPIDDRRTATLTVRFSGSAVETDI